MEKKYNLLTQKLLEEGYTVDNHPGYVYVERKYNGRGNPLENFHGGFQYYGWYAYGKIYKTPCGIQCKGTSCMTGLSTGHKDFTFENDRALVKCPYHDRGCMQKDSLLQQNGPIRDWCNVRMVNEEYQYNGSVEGILKLEDDRIRREKIEFEMKHNGRTCPNHMYYDREKGEWTMEYNPCSCAKLKCHGQIGGKYDENGHQICPILDRPLDSKKGNVFYDIKTRSYRDDLDGTLFEGQVDTHILKGVRFLKSPVSMDICRKIVKFCQDEIEWHVRSEYHDRLFFAAYHNREFSVEVLNIRAEHRESRDLMQDLQDIRDGISITHESDRLSQVTRNKKERREKSRQKRIAAMEKKILSMGYGNMEAVDQNRACKLLSIDRIDELESMREENEQKEHEKPMQLSLFDFMARDGGEADAKSDSNGDKESPG